MKRQEVNIRGVTRLPDDSASENGQLAHAVNLAADGTGLRPLEKPQLLFELNEGEEVVAIHKNSGYFHYLLRGSNGHLLYVNAAQDGTVTATTRVDTNITIAATTKISVIGNTLCLYGGTVSYILWRDDAYHNLGARPPRLMLRFALSDAKMECSPKGNSNAKWTWRGSTQDVPIFYPGPENESWNLISKESLALGYSSAPLFSDYMKAYDVNLEDAIGTSDTSEAKINEFVDGLTTLALARANKMLADAHRKNRFVMPFFIRYGYRLFDGSVIMHSDPILMVPNLKSPVFLINHMKVREHAGSNNNRSVEINGKAWATTAKLSMHRLNEGDNDNQWHGLEEWKDIITSVGIYVSEPLYTYDQAGKVYGWEYCLNFDPEDPSAEVEPYVDTETEGRCWNDRWGITNRVTDDAQTTEPTAWEKRPMKDEIQVVRDNEDFPFMRLIMPDKTEVRMREEIANCSNFYLLCEIPTDDIRDYEFLDYDKYVKDGTLETITQRHMMPDDNYTRDTTSADLAYAYNNRLHIAEPVRQLAPPMPVGCSWTWWKVTDNSVKKSYWDIAVLTDKGILATMGHTDQDDVQPYYSRNESLNDGLPLFLFFPNEKAKTIVLQEHRKVGATTTNYLYQVDLTPHLRLNGAYWLADLWGTDPTPLVSGSFPTPTVGGVKEEQPHTLISSNAMNPFYFAADNFCETGDGTVRALAVATEAMSEGQFGQHPLYVFTTDGVLALRVGDDGKFTSTHPVSRDIIKDGTQPLNLDKNVVFFTDRGIVALSGSTTRSLTAAVWHGLSATDVPRIADLKQLAGLSGSMPDIEDCDRMLFDYRHQRIYASNGEKSWVLSLTSGLWTQSDTVITAPLNSYPQAIFVAGDDVMTLDTEEKYENALAVTRPIKLGEFAKIRAIRARGFFDPHTANMKTVLLGSRTWKDYKVMRSAIGPAISAHGGSPMRSHVIAFAMHNIDSLNSFSIIFDNEQFNVLR